MTTTMQAGQRSGIQPSDQGMTPQVMLVALWQALLGVGLVCARCGVGVGGNPGLEHARILQPGGCGPTLSGGSHPSDCDCCLCQRLHGLATEQ